MLIIGIDIGGTKSATVIAEVLEEKVLFKNRVEFATLKTPMETIKRLIFNIESQLKELKTPIDYIEKLVYLVVPIRCIKKTHHVAT